MAKPWEKDEIIRGPWDKDEPIGAEPPPPAVATDQVVPEKPLSYLGNLKQYWTKDIPETGKNLLSGLATRGSKIWGPTEIGERIGVDKESHPIIEGIVGAPERIARTALQGVSAAGDVGMAGLSLAGKAANRWSGGIFGNLAQPVAESVKPIAQKAERIYSAATENMTPAEKINYSTTMEGFLNLSGLKGAGATPAATSRVLSETGNVLKKSGRKGLEETYKITTPIAKQAGPNKYQGVQKILDWMDSYKLEGRPKAVAKQAQNQLDDLTDKTEKMIDDYAAKNPSETMATKKLHGDIMQDISQSAIPGIAMFTPEEQAAALARITGMLERKGLTGDIPISRLPELKSTLTEEVGLYTKGAVTPEANLVKKLGREYYNRAKTALEEKIPEIAQPNTDIHRLIIIKDAAEDAAQRIGNRYDIGLRELITMTMVPAATGIATHGDLGISGAAALGGSVLASQKILGGGRLAGLKIKAGRKLQELGGKPPIRPAAPRTVPGVAPITAENRLLTYQRSGIDPIPPIEKPVPMISERLAALGTIPESGLTQREFRASREKLRQLELKNKAIGEQIEPPIVQSGYREGMLRNVLGSERGAIGAVGEDLITKEQLQGLSKERWGIINNKMKKAGYDWKGPDDAKALTLRLSEKRGGINNTYPDLYEALKYELTPKASKNIEEKILSKATRYFGLTDDPRFGGYIMPNGKMLDLSGIRQGNIGATSRGLDHREIGAALENLDHPAAQGGTDGMNEFIKIGPIRVDHNSGAINIGSAPSVEQRKAIDKFIRTSPSEEIHIELKNNGEPFYKEYPKSEKYQALKDIEAYYSGQEKQSLGQSLAQQFHERGSIGSSGPSFRSAQQTSPQFKKWFGDWESDPANASKVVDDEGRPLVVYHGTNADFNEYDMGKIGSGGWASRGGEKNALKAGNAIYTTSSISHARDYGRHQIPLYVDIKNPIKYDAKQAILDWKEESGAFEKTIEEFLEDMGGAYNAVDADALFNRLIRQAYKDGNDGVIVDFGDISDEGKVVIPLNPSQIKSATGNTGVFSRATNDIRGNTVLPMLGLTGGVSGAGLATLAAYKAKKEKGKR